LALVVQEHETAEIIEAEALSISSYISMLVMALCFIAGALLMTEVAWQYWRSVYSAGFEPAQNDLLSQREAYLTRKVLSLATSVIDGRDMKITVQVDSGDKNGLAEGVEVKAVLILVNRPAHVPDVEEALAAVVTAGLALNTARGDQLSVQFRAFSKINNGGNAFWGLALIHRLYLAVGLLLIGGSGFAWAYHRYQQLRAKTRQLESDYLDQLRRFQAIAEEEPARVASVLSDWLNGARG
jgi:hypothetical protein